MPTDTPNLFKRILIAVDQSTPAAWALETGENLARTLGAQIALVHVVEAAAGFTPEMSFVHFELVEDHRRAGQALLAKAEEEMPGGIQCERILREGRAGDEIVNAAQDWGADLIVVGTHGHGRLARLLLGSTAEAVVRHAPCPVLTVGFRPNAPTAPAVAQANSSLVERLRKPETDRRPQAVCIKDLLKSNGVPFTTIDHPTAYTAEETAAAAHIRAKEVAKSVMVNLDGKIAMIVLRSSEKLDLDRVLQVTHAAHVRLAREEEFENLFPGCERVPCRHSAISTACGSTSTNCLRKTRRSPSMPAPTRN